MDNVPLPIDLGDLILRRLEPRDVADLLEIKSNPEVVRYEFFGCWSESDVQHCIQSQARVQIGDPGVPLILAVELIAEHKLIGDCQITINSIDDRQGEIGFAFNPAYGGRGYATRAVHAALGFGFRSLGLHRITAATDVRNERSWRLLERIGMRREAHFRHDNLVADEWVDDFVYAMLEHEWDESPGKRLDGRGGTP